MLSQGNQGQDGGKGQGLEQHLKYRFYSTLIFKWHLCFKLNVILKKLAFLNAVSLVAHKRDFYKYKMVHQHSEFLFFIAKKVIDVKRERKENKLVQCLWSKRSSFKGDVNLSSCWINESLQLFTVNGESHTSVAHRLRKNDK